MTRRSLGRCIRLAGAAGLAGWLFVGVVIASAGAGGIAPAHVTPPVRGLWVTVFSTEHPFSSRAALEQFFTRAEFLGIQTVFLQVYRGDQAWFRSSVADDAPFQRAQQTFGNDPLAAFLRAAHQRHITVHAWLNVLSLSTNAQAKVLTELGTGALTVDQDGHASLAKPDTRVITFVLEKQLFLEPGDPRVQQHVVAVTTELLQRYPELDGLHLDYIRYPYAVPSIPSATFQAQGLSYGFAPANVTRFQEATQLNPRHKVLAPATAHRWDDWRRLQVSQLVERVAQAVRQQRQGLRISCAVMPSVERAYGVVFQDWPLWVDKGWVDFVVLMNYTTDVRWFTLNARTATALAPGRVHLGIGLHLLKDDAAVLADTLTVAQRLQPAGLTFFSYEETRDPNMRKALAR